MRALVLLLSALLNEDGEAPGVKLVLPAAVIAGVKVPPRLLVCCSVFHADGKQHCHSMPLGDR